MTFPHDLLRTIYKDPATSRRIRRRIRASLEPVEVDYKGCRMFVHPADNNTEFQIWRLGRTHEERALRDILQRLAGAPFFALDVGANAGSFSVRLAAIAPEGSVIHAFEPNPVMRARLEHNLSLNKASSVIVHDCAISDENDELELCIPAEQNLGQARLSHTFSNGSEIRVKVRSLTEFLPENPAMPVDFLKVDIEGFEDRAIGPVISDAPVQQRPRLIFFEHKHNVLWKTDITARIRDAGYMLCAEYGRNALFERQS
ncbi:FkbM family methyltransferase [Roseobacter sp.]|uniref:FkbM family methyltransferase n=1 Tax=Roseobacter sp. TaxID=1907202 RepID=UPI0025CDDF9E|nr:FkbM family methyltransferase [Roseobacter sp.]